MTVTGVVRDLRYRDLDTPPPAIYVPMRQSSFPARFLIVRAGVDDVPVLSLTQRAVKAIDPSEPVTEASSIDALLANELAGPRFHMLALGLFAVVAVLLVGVGVFGVLGAFVAQRSRELGVRVALGAVPADLRRLVLSKLGWPVAVGLCARNRRGPGGRAADSTLAVSGHDIRRARGGRGVDGAGARQRRRVVRPDAPGQPHRSRDPAAIRLTATSS